jgi:surface polysaccharide O-acyltransferase-like enzyme
VTRYFPPARYSPRAFAGVALVGATVFFLSPTTAIDIWPWTLTPLTARVLASFTAQVGVGALVLSLDRRWGTWRLIVETFFVATAFLLVGAARAWDDFDEGNVMTYLYIGGLIAADAALLTLFIRTEASARAHDRHLTAPAS